MAAPTLTTGFTAVNGDTCDATYLNNFVSTGGASLATDKVIGRSTAGTGQWETITCDTYGRAIIGAGSVAAQLTALGIGSAGTLSGVTLVSSARYEAIVTTLTYGATVTLDLSSNSVQTIALTGNITFNTSNLTAGRAKQVLVACDTSARTLTFPSWVWLGGSAPSSIAASKSALLTLISFGTADTSVVATWTVQA